ncbi:hypothetical protein D3C71_78590 [compost metagenome]
MSIHIRLRNKLRESIRQTVARMEELRDRLKASIAGEDEEREFPLSDAGRLKAEELLRKTQQKIDLAYTRMAGWT